MRACRSAFVPLLFLLLTLASTAARADNEVPRDSLPIILARKTLRVGVHPGLPPFEAVGAAAADLRRRSGNPLAIYATDGREVAGLDIDLAQSAAHALGVTLEIVLIDRFDDLLPGLQAGHYDVVMSALTETLPRAMTVAFSDPYFVSGLQVLVHDTTRFATLSDLAAHHARVGVRGGTTGDSFARSDLSGVVVRTLPSEDAMFTAMDRGQLDALVVDYVTARDIEVRKRVHVSLSPIDERRFTLEHFAFAVRHGDRDWLGWLNLMLRESRSTGEFHQLAARYNAWFRSER